jgi:hypothetical protein
VVVLHGLGPMGVRAMTKWAVILSFGENFFEKRLKIKEVWWKS